MHITPLAGLRFRLPCGNRNLSADADAMFRRNIAYLINIGRHGKDRDATTGICATGRLDLVPYLLKH
ncbi:MAG: hypothetical protein LBU34_13370 [Planctomycetaceae bacterium]|nr:hypothetical protein [Planctomycetaceae bacterium]